MRMRKNYSELAIQVSQPTSFALNKARSHAKSFVVEKGQASLMPRQEGIGTEKD